MNITTGESADEFFGGDVSNAVREMLHRAAAAHGDERSALLWTALSMEPHCLATTYALYKHHAGRREFEAAERAAWRGLAEAALAAGLPQDWRAAPAPLPPAVRDSTAGGFWLFTLKALAFIHLRTQRHDQARELLAQLQACHPQAGNGADVTAALLQATRPGP